MVSDLRDLAGGFQVLGAGGEIQQGGHAAERVEAEQGNGQTLHVGQQHADILTRLRHLSELSPEHECTEHQPSVGDRLAFRIFERDLVAPILIAGIDESAKKAFARLRDVELGQNTPPRLTMSIGVDACTHIAKHWLRPHFILIGVCFHASEISACDSTMTNVAWDAMTRKLALCVEEMEKLKRT